MRIDWEVIVAASLGFLTQYGFGILGGVIIAIVGWMLAGWAGRAVDRAAQRNKRLGPTVAPVLGKTARVAILLAVLIAVLDAIGVETTALLAALGAVGLGIGLALKDTISDIAAGVLLLGLRPFDVGDAIDLGGGTMGTVEAIDLFETKLTGFEGIPLVLPNRTVRNGVIKNFTRAQKRRIDLTIGIAYDSDVDRALAVVRELVASDSRLLTDPEPLINTSALADSSIELLVRVWTLPADFFPTQLDLHRTIKLAFDAAGIVIPFPQRDVHLVGDKAA